MLNFLLTLLHHCVDGLNEEGINKMLKVTKIVESHISELVGLFIDCFGNDSYFTAIYPSAENRFDRMTEDLTPRLEFCVLNDGAYGIYKEDVELIAYILFFRYKELRQSNPERFKSFFRGVPDMSELNNKIDRLDGQVIHLLSMGVAPNYRQQGIASRLIDYINNQYQDSHFVGYITKPSLLHFYKKREFVTEELYGGNYLIKRIPKIRINDRHAIPYNTISFLDFDGKAGNLHKLCIHKSELTTGLEAGSLYSASRTRDAIATSKDSIEIFNQKETLIKFKHEIESTFNCKTKVVKAKAKQYHWYCYLRVSFPNEAMYDIVPYRWFILNGMEVAFKNQIWHQGIPAFEHEDNVWQWQNPKIKKKAMKLQDRSIIRVLRKSYDYFPKIDGSDLDIANSFGKDIVHALLHWKPLLAKFCR